MHACAVMIGRVVNASPAVQRVMSDRKALLEKLRAPITADSRGLIAAHTLLPHDDTVARAVLEQELASIQQELVELRLSIEDGTHLAVPKPAPALVYKPILVERSTTLNRKTEAECDKLARDQCQTARRSHFVKVSQDFLRACFANLPRSSHMAGAS